MRFVYYYPMFHVLDREHWERVMISSVNGTSLEKAKREEIGVELKKLIGIDYKKIQDLWEDFNQKLRDMEHFDRVYFESISHDNGVDTVKGDSSMSRCLRYLVNQGTRFEKCESQRLRNLCKRFEDDPKIFRSLQDLRDGYLIKRVDETLKDGERGLILWGALHFDGIIKRLNEIDVGYI